MFVSNPIPVNQNQLTLCDLGGAKVGLDDDVAALGTECGSNSLG